MNKPSMIGLGLLALLGAGAANAGNCNDAWVTRAIQEVTGRAPSGSGNSGDCNIQIYGNGHWSSYADLVGKVRAAKAAPAAPMPQAGVCKDAWVTRAVKEVTGRAPGGAGTTGDCNVQKYGNGHWSSYADLVSKVRTANGMAPAPKPSLAAPPPGNRPGLLLGGANASGRGNVIAPGGGNVVAGGGGNVIAPGGGNVIAPGGGNVVAGGGGNVVAGGGGNLIGQDGAGLARRSVQSISRGQCSDPWVTKAIQEVTGRAPSGSGNSGDCSVQRYGNGRWSSYADLVAKVRAAPRHR